MATEQSLYTDISFLPFIPPPVGNYDDLLDEWTSYLETIDVDIHYLLKLPHDKFWAQAVHDKSLHKLLDSYLQHTQRPYEIPWLLSSKTKETLRNVHKRMFLSLLRLSTNQETKISSQLFADLLYNNYIFDISRMVDMCCIYGESNTTLLNKMINNIFTKQPKYWDDLTKAMDNVAKILDTFTIQCTEEYTDSDSLSVPDLILYYSDIVYSLKTLLLVYPPTSHTLWMVKLPEKLVCFFETNIPVLKSLWKDLKNEEENSLYVSSRFGQAIKDTCDLIHSLIISVGSLEARKGVESMEGAESSCDVNSMIGLFTLMASEKIFLTEFQKSYSLRDCLYKVKDSHPLFDESQIAYILLAVDSVGVASEDEVKSKPRPSVSGKDLDQKIKYIKDILPHLEDEFIKNCLKEFNYDHEVVVERYLEKQLPPHLMSREVLEPHPPDEHHHSTSDLMVSAELVDSRSNVYDFDEFDIMHKKEIDWIKIHIGKRHESSHSILSDKSHVSYMKGRGLDLLPEFDEYDDEYDDTYDSHNIGATDQDSTEELPIILRLNQKGQFSKDWKSNDDNDQSINTDTNSLVESVTVTTNTRHTTATVQQTKHQKKQKEVPRNDVKLNDQKLPKSEQTTEKEDKTTKGSGGNTQHYRQYKERSKGVRANHNRKSASDKKRKAF